MLINHIPGQNSIVRLALAMALSVALVACGGQPTSDDPTTPPTSGLSIYDASATEGATLNFIVTLSAAVASPVTFNYVTIPGTATVGDFISTSGSGSIDVGSRGAVIQVPTVQDSLDEPNKLFAISLSAISGVTASRSAAVGTIVDDDATPQLVISDATLTEGQSAVFTVSATGLSASNMVVNFATASGTASASDFTSKSGKITISSGQNTASIAIATNDDALYELNETFTVNLSSPVNATLLDAVGLATLSDNDTMPSVNINSASVNEGSTLSFAVSLSAASGVGTLITYSSQDQTAIAGSDYTAVAGTLSIAAGATSGAIKVFTTNDTMYEANETLLVTLSSAVNATLATSSAVGTINNSDSFPDLKVWDVSVSEGQTANFKVSLSNSNSSAITFNYQTYDGTATSPADYSGTSGTISLNPGMTSVTISVPTVDDTAYEPAETFTLSISSLSNANGLDVLGVATIALSDPPPNIYIANPSAVAEGGTLAFTVSLSATSSSTVFFDATSVGGTASSGVDYNALSGTFSIASGSLSTVVTLPTIDDVIDEGSETVIVTLTNLVNALVGKSGATGSITDNDPSPIISIDDTAITEGQSALLTVSISAVSGLNVTFNYATKPGTALAGSDYVTKSANATIPAGSLTTVLSFASVNDVSFESTEMFNVSLSTIINATAGKFLGAVTVIDNDTPPTINVANASVSEGGTLQFIVSLTSVSGLATTFDYVTADGTAALADSDYVAKSGTGTINAGSLSVLVKVPTVQDSTYEPNETLSLSLSNPVNATAGTMTATGTIVNDDATAGIVISDSNTSEGGTLTFTVSMSSANASDVTFDYQTLDGTASGGTDYNSDTASATILAGQLTTQIKVITSDDSVAEYNETLLVSLSNPANTTIADDVGVGTINDNDPDPQIYIDATIVNEGLTAVATVSLSEASAKVVSVHYSTIDGSAHAPADYISASGNLTFMPGNSVSVILISTSGDPLYEPSEDFQISLSSPVNTSAAIDVGLVTINDDDAFPTLTISNATTTEGGTLHFVVSLSSLTSQNVSFTYQTHDSSATSPFDYSAQLASATIAAGADAITLAVATVQDSFYEGVETFDMSLTSITNATPGQAVATGIINDDESSPNLFISDSAVTEGATLLFVVSIAATSATDVTFNYTSLDATASSGSDYTSKSGVATIQAGQLTTIVAINSIDDATAEYSETFGVSISSVVGATAVDDYGLGTLNDNDVDPQLAIDPAATNEGSPATLIAYLPLASGKPITFDYTTFSGSAVSGSDFNATSGTLTIMPGSLSVTFNVSTINDVVYEGNETFLVSLSSASNSSFANDSATVTINDNDAVPTINISNGSVAEGGTLQFIVSLTSLSATDVTFDYATTNGTANSPADYTSLSGSGTIAAGASALTLLVVSAEDALNESNEAFTLDLSNVVNASTGSLSGLGTIVDNDPAPTLTIIDSTVAENANLQFIVSLSAVSGQLVTFNYATNTGSASAGSDYTSTSGSTLISVGAQAVTISVAVNDDTLAEFSETLTMTLSSPGNASFADAVAVGTINDNDVDPQISISGAAVTEGQTALVIVTLTAASGKPISFDYSTVAASASSGSDFTAASGTITIAAGATGSALSVVTIDDIVSESSETLSVTLSSPVNTSLLTSQANVTINDNDALPSIKMYPIAVSEGGTLNFVVSLSALSGLDVTLNYSTFNGSATTGDSDYTSVSNKALTITAGGLTVLAPVVTTQDGKFEANEALTVSLSSVTNATVNTPGADDLAVGTINNDDTQPNLYVTDATITEGQTAVIWATLSAIAGVPVTFTYATQDGTALQPGDYTQANSTGTIAAGNLSIGMPIVSTQDSTYEASESLSVTLSTLNNAAAADTYSAITINDDDSMPAVFIGDVTITEGQTAQFVATLSATSSVDVTFNYQTVAGTALAGSDYTTVGATSATISAGSLAITLPVVSVNDAINEATESFNVTLTALSGATSGRANAIGTINDNDAQPGIFIANASATEGGTLQFVVSLSSVSGQNVTFNFAAVNGTAVSGSDYTSPSAAQTITAGSSSILVNVVTVNDVLYEFTETLSVNISSVVNATGSVTVAGGTITDNDTMPNVFIGDSSVNEAQTAIFAVSISALSAVDSVVNFSTVDNTALSGSDYVASSGTVTISAGSLTTSIAVVTSNDALYEATETYNLTLTALSNVGTGDVSGLGTIVNTTAMPNLAISDAEAIEAQTAVFTVSISAVSGLNTVFNYATLAGTATAGTDYTTASGTATIPAGSQTVALKVVTLTDVTAESTETFTMSLSAITNANSVDNLGAGSIVDNDTTPNMYISDSTVTEGGTMVFTVSVSNPRTVNITVVYANKNNTAVAPGDYATTSGTLTILPGTYSQNISVASVQDTSYEGNETFWISLSGAVSATLVDNLGVGTINDDDPVPTILVSSPTINEGETANFLVSLSNPRSTNVTFSYTTVNGTAVSGSDFTTISGTGTIVAGSLTTSYNVVSTEDEINEPVTEQFTLSLSSVTGTTNSAVGAISTITDDDLCTRSVLDSYRNGTAAAAGYDALAIGSITLITVGNDTGTQTQWIARRSLNSGSSWTVTGTYQETAGRAAVAKGIVRDSLGNIFSTGSAVYRPGGPTNMNEFITRMSTDNGATWVKVDTFFLVGGSSKHAYGTGIAVDTADNLWAVGHALDASSVDHWNTRLSINNGTSWTTSDDYNLTITAGAYANAVATDSSNNVYAVGAASDGTANHWIVRKYNGTSWATVDNYQYSANLASEARGIAIDSSGYIYVAGVGNIAGGNTWIVRKSTNGGSTWTVVDTFQWVTGQASSANAVTVNSSGHVYVAGQGTEASGFTRWIVRRSQNNGSVWDTVDAYQNTANKNSAANGLTVDANGDFIVVGTGTDATSAQFVTRKMVCP